MSWKPHREPMQERAYGFYGDGCPEGRSRHRRHRVTALQLRRLKKRGHEVARRVRVSQNRLRGRHDRASLRRCPLCRSEACLWMTPDGRYLPVGPHGYRFVRGQVFEAHVFPRVVTDDERRKLDEYLTDRWGSVLLSTVKSADKSAPRPEDDPRAGLLVATLSCAVPMWVERLKRMTPEQRSARAAECGQHVAEHGDVILYRSKKKGASADAFNALAEGLACLSFAPGGVRFLGLHFETKLETEP